MTYKMLLQCLREARERVRDFAGIDAGVVDRSQETVDLIMQRLNKEGISEAMLLNLAKRGK